MPMIDCERCLGTGRVRGRLSGAMFPCGDCLGTGRVPDDFFPEDSSELLDPDEEPEQLTSPDTREE